MSPRRKRTRPPTLPNAGFDNDPIVRTVSRAVFYLVLLFAVHMLWRGHYEPGGGFIAGLIVAAALVLHRIATGTAALRANPQALLAWGLLIAIMTGLGPVFFGGMFLQSAYGYIDLPVIGEFAWATAVLFDIGVFLLVIGSATSVIASLAQAPATAPADTRGEIEEAP